MKWSESERFLSTDTDLGKHIETVQFYAERSSSSADAMGKLLQKVSASQEFNPIVAAAKNDQNFAAQRDILERIKAAIPDGENIHSVTWRVLKGVPIKPIEPSSPEEYVVWLLVDEISKKFVISLRTDSEEYHAIEGEHRERDAQLLMVEGLDEQDPKSWREYGKIVEVLGLNEAPRYRILALVRDAMEREWAGRPLTSKEQ